MNTNYLEIDLSRSNKESDNEDLTKIRLKSGNTAQFNFFKFFFRSKFVFDKYSEIMKFIEREIVEIENKFSIKEEIIKEFIEIISKDKVFIPIEHFKDIYTLSNHFCIPKLTNLLDNMMGNLNNNDINFCIQILLDNQEKTNKEEIDIVIKIENILKSRVNECLKNDKFKEVPIQTIYRIISSAISSDHEIVDVNILLDFIIESAENRFILFKFIEIHRLMKDKLDKFIKFIDEQEENLQRKYLDYIPFNFLFVKELSKLFQQNQTELKQTKEELKQMKQENNELSNEFKNSQIEINKIQKELEQVKEKLAQINQRKNEMKQYSRTLMVVGYDKNNQLGVNPNKNDMNTPYIYPCQTSSIDPSSLLSFSIYSDHAVQVTKNGKLLGIGNNRNGKICDSLPKTEITEFTEFSISNGRQLDPISAVCNDYGTLYMFSSGSSRQLVLCLGFNGGHPVFLDIGNEYPVSLFGGNSHFVAISKKGEVIFINCSSGYNSLESKIKTVCLPDGEKAVSVACCRFSVVALSSNGRVFLSAVESGSSVLNFSTVSELSGQEIVWVSGTNFHFLAVSREGRVFGRGSNKSGELGLGQQIENVSSFTEVSSLNGNKIRAAYAGCGHSLFETYDGKILACGSNYLGRLLINNDEKKDFYSPIETTITRSATFCIADYFLSAVFVGGDPPPNIPNRLIENE